MNNKGLKYIFGLMLLAVLMVVGCGSGGSQSVLQEESPETAVMRISDSWRTSTTSPSVVVDKNNRFIRQANVQETDPESSSNPGKKVIYLKDLAGGSPYELEVVNVDRFDNEASVTCNFYYESGTLIIVFKLVFEDGKWWLDDIEITDKAFEKGEAAYLVEHYLYSGDNLDKVVSDDLIIDKIDAKVEAKPRNDFDNYVFISTDTRNIATGTVLASDNSAYPLTLKLYYKKLTNYTVTFYFLDKSNNIVSDKTIGIDEIGFVGETVKFEEENYETFEGYKLISNDISDRIKNITEITLKDGEANELILYYELEGVQPEEGNEIKGTVTDEEGNPLAVSIQLYKVNEKGDTDYIETLESENGEYYFNELEDGDYLLVIYASGHEPKTIKVTLPDTEKSNTRANIKL